MRDNYKKVNNVGKMSSSLFLLFVFLAVNPAVGSSVFAEGIDDGDRELESEDYDGNVDGADDELELYASSSSVGIAFSPTSPVNTSVTPVGGDGAKAKINVQATVSVQNSDGYKVYIHSTSNQLKNGSNVIDPVTTATTYANLPANKWGYSYRRANSATDKTVQDSYNAITTTTRGTQIDANANKGITSDIRYYMLSFAANIGADKPAGTYSNSVTMSVVSSAQETAATWATLTTMQGMTTEICSSAATGASKQLMDVRDGKYYWVGKLADGNCWMTQNLDLDLSNSVMLTPADTDVSANWLPEYDTAAEVTSSTILNGGTSALSWSLGNYRIINPNTSSDCGIKKTSVADCPQQFTAYNMPMSANGQANAHYILGNHYQWLAATAGTGSRVTGAGGQAAGSVCSKGWRLPMSTELHALVTTLDAASNTNNFTGAPFYAVRGGYVYPTQEYLLHGAGDRSFYWSSTLYQYSGQASYLSASGTTYTGTGGNTWRYGNSVRCIAR